MRWQITNFKGIARAEFDISPGHATVITGVNSSGKSSTIQSLLLTAQSLYDDGPIVLNGPLVRLGDAEDLVREGAESNSIGIRLNLDPARSARGPSDPEAQVSYELVSSEDHSTLRARRVTIERTEFSSEPFVLARQNSRGSDVELALQATRHFGECDVLHVKSLLGDDRRQLRTYVAMQGLRPVVVVQLLSPEAVRTRYRKAFAAWIAEDERVAHPLDGLGTAPSIARDFARVLSDVIQRDEFSESGLQDAVRSRGLTPSRLRRAMRELDASQRDAILDIAADQRARSPWVCLPVKQLWSFRSMSDGVLEAQLEEILGDSYVALLLLSECLDDLSQRVQYLGPLRDEPRVVWNHWNELARGLPVGTRGEFSAAVLSRGDSALVSYRSPNGEPKMAPLSSAVNEWLAHLEIGDDVVARPRGKLGVGFDLQINGRTRDLTSVGVGVSQALPLLVGLLKSPQSSVFIVEQPELHLHPAVQARLADFLLRARPDMSVIVETHSEAFITRIRRRAAEGTLPLKDVDIAFVETSDSGSVARRLGLTEFGDLSEWPEGFLSSTEEDIREILRHNVERARGSLDV
ncbi:AAA family ATPase [Protaetiibacter intestinalis]|uniref:ATPase AAA-type core domain-containing protein n=1 Tax=Protaetiibacter intestinalis TaxID=2419774 RepID=A0A387BJF2_9MICO|nr:AAA family ATPase [Protaetiibacter intestinalis]AYF98650.1 hypothetical protein D7I47_10525 [Protaetiibacter intestinalis]